MQTHSRHSHRPFGRTGRARLVHRPRRLASGRPGLRRGGGAAGARGHRRRHHVSRQRVGLQRRPQREAHGQGHRRPSRPGVPDDEGLHARPRRQGRDAAARRLATPLAHRLSRPVADPRGCLRRRAGEAFRARRSGRGARARAPAGQSALRRVSPATRIRRCTWRCWRTTSSGTRASCRSTASTPRSAASRQQVLPELNRRGIAPIGMKSLGGDGRAVKAKVVSAEEALELRDEPASRDGRQRHRLDARAEAERRRRARLQADECTRARKRCCGASRNVRSTAASSSTRFRRVFEGRGNHGACTGCPSQAELADLK